MSQVEQEKSSKKDAMKKLRKERKQKIGKASGMVKEQQKAVKDIKEKLKEDIGTIPMIAEATGISPDQVLWYLSTMKKYGEVMEAEKDGSYFKYALAEVAADEASSDQIDESR